MKPVLHNAEGQPVVSLPEPRPHDAPASIKEARQRLSACRKQLAHATLLEPAQVSAWMRHLRDYKLAPLFAQLHHAAPPSALRAGPHIEDRLGWLSDNFALRGAFAKRGYVREAAIDGGMFEAYRKDFSGAGLRVRISFSGSQLPGERQPAALKALAFQRLPGLLAVPLAQVPGVLLAEAYADYHAVATSGAYDEHWESKVPF